MVTAMWLLGLTTGWASLYANSKALITAVTFLHLAGIMLGGGAAVTFDRLTLRLSRASAAARTAHLAQLEAVHTMVLVGLGMMFVSGALMFAADVDTFAGSRLFWLKMLVVALVVGNGALIVRARTWLGVSGEERWGRLKAVSVVSLVLWLAAVLLGTLLATTA